MLGSKQRMRNRIVHDPWYFHFNDDGTTTGYRLEQSAAKTAVRKLIEQDHEKLETLIKDVHPSASRSPTNRRKAASRSRIASRRLRN